jgi:hypothetical protein
MRMLFDFLLCSCFCLGPFALHGQITVATPTNDEAKATCLTLERLLVTARNDNRVQDAAALSLAYSLARKYVTDPSSVKGADDYIQFFQSHVNLAAVSPPTPTTTSGGITWMPPMGDMASDQNHKSGVIVYGNNGSMENLHLTMDKDSVTNLLKANGAVAAETGKP